jgi:hypothetical protein
MHCGRPFTAYNDGSEVAAPSGLGGLGGGAEPAVEAATTVGGLGLDGPMGGLEALGPPPDLGGDAGATQADGLGLDALSAPGPADSLGLSSGIDFGLGSLGDGDDPFGEPLGDPTRVAAVEQTRPAGPRAMSDAIGATGGAGLDAGAPATGDMAASHGGLGTLEPLATPPPGPSAPPKPRVEEAPLALDKDRAAPRRPASRSPDPRRPDSRRPDPRRPDGGRRSQTGHRPEQAGARAERPIAAAQPAAASGEQFGLGFVLWLLMAGGLVVGAVVAIGLDTGLMSLPPTVASEVVAEPSAALAKGVQELEAGRYTAAALLLQRAAEVEGEDPRVYRHLALALHRTGRSREAREAITEYRRRLAQMGR